MKRSGAGQPHCTGKGVQVTQIASVPLDLHSGELCELAGSSLLKLTMLLFLCFSEQLSGRCISEI